MTLNLHQMHGITGIFMLIGTVILKVIAMATMNEWASVGTLIAALATAFYFITKGIYLIRNKGKDEK